MEQYILNGVVQAIAAVIVVSIWFGTSFLIARIRGKTHQSWARWLGLYLPPRPRDGLRFFTLFFVFGAVVALLTLFLVPGYFDMSRQTPQYAIAALPITGLLVAALSYAFVTTGFAEELFFRAVLAKRLMEWLGFHWGNLIQASIFGLIHALLVRIGAPQAGVLTYSLVGISIGALAWVAGWAMQVRGAGSLFFPWLMHSAANLATIGVYVVWLRLAYSA